MHIAVSILHEILATDPSLVGSISLGRLVRHKYLDIIINYYFVEYLQIYKNILYIFLSLRSFRLKRGWRWWSSWWLRN